LNFKRSFGELAMARSDCSVGRVGLGLRRFAGQLAVSVAATLCATAIYGHFASERPAPRAQPGSLAALPASPLRAEGGAIDARTLTYYPEHLAALASLTQFRPVSAQRTAELAGATPMRLAAALADATLPRSPGPAGILPPRRPLALAQVEVLPPRRPSFAAAPELAGAPEMAVASATSLVVGETAPPLPARAKIWGLELPHFVPTGAAVLEKLTSVKQTVGGLMHVSSR
jgi:hypothetical protein